MDTGTLNLMGLRAVNKALIDGLKAAIYSLEKVNQISEEQRKSISKSLNSLIAESGEVYGEAPTRN